MSKPRSTTKQQPKPSKTAGDSNPACPYCERDAELVTGVELYGDRGDVKSKYWRCVPCAAWVGCHAGTDIPFGSLADAGLRLQRRALHERFDRYWRRAKVDRGVAYRWLAESMSLSVDDCHIGKFLSIHCAIANRVLDDWSEQMSDVGLEAMESRFARIEIEFGKSAVQSVEKMSTYTASLETYVQFVDWVVGFDPAYDAAEGDLIDPYRLRHIVKPEFNSICKRLLRRSDATDQAEAVEIRFRRKLEVSGDSDLVLYVSACSKSAQVWFSCKNHTNDWFHSPCVDGSLLGAIQAAVSAKNVASNGYELQTIKNISLEESALLHPLHVFEMIRDGSAIVYQKNDNIVAFTVKPSKKDSVELFRTAMSPGKLIDTVSVVKVLRSSWRNIFNRLENHDKTYLVSGHGMRIRSSAWLAAKAYEYGELYGESLKQEKNLNDSAWALAYYKKWHKATVGSLLLGMGLDDLHRYLDGMLYAHSCEKNGSKLHIPHGIQSIDYEMQIELAKIHIEISKASVAVNQVASGVGSNGEVKVSALPKMPTVVSGGLPPLDWQSAPLQWPPAPSASGVPTKPHNPSSGKGGSVDPSARSIPKIDSGSRDIEW